MAVRAPSPLVCDQSIDRISQNAWETLQQYGRRAQYLPTDVPNHHHPGWQTFRWQTNKDMTPLYYNVQAYCLEVRKRRPSGDLATARRISDSYGVLAREPCIRHKQTRSLPSRCFSFPMHVPAEDLARQYCLVEGSNCHVGRPVARGRGDGPDILEMSPLFPGYLAFQWSNPRSYFRNDHFG